MDKDFFIIVCIGDSLTAGYRAKDPYAFDRRIPYPAQLESLVRRWLSEKRSTLQAFVLNVGVNGDSTDGMLSRFDSNVALEKPEAVVIWGGINDLFIGRSPQSVVDNLIRICDKCIGIGSRPVLCSLSHSRSYLTISERVNETNRLLKHYCKVKGVVYVDINSAISDNDGRLQGKYSDDGTHLSALGYSEVAKAIFKVIVPFLKYCIGDQYSL